MIVVTIFGIVSVIILLPILYWYYILFKNRSLNGIPGPKPLMFLGSVLPRDPYEMSSNFAKLHEIYGPTVKLYIGPYLNILVSKPDHMQAVLSSTIHLDKTFGYDTLKPWLGEGLILAKGSKWKGRRKLLNPSFHFKILEGFMHIFDQAGDILIAKLSKEVGGDSVEIFDILNHFALDVICETSMGVKINAQIDPNNQHSAMLKKFLEIAMWRFMCGWASIDFLFWLFANDTYHKYMGYINQLKTFTNDVIETKRKEYREMASSNKGKNDEEDFYRKPKRALLDFLLTSEETKSFTNEDLREEIENFMFAGHDTVTTALSLTLLQLSRHREIQNKLYEEIKSVTEDNVEVTINTLNEMKYLDMVLKESLRSMTPVPMIFRKIHSDCNIDGTKFVKGTIVAMNIKQMHEDPEIYPDPEKFDPERFTLENQINRHNYAFIPFSAGPRNCIGLRFATIEMKTTLVKILKNFELLPVPGFKERLGFTGVTKSETGACIRLARRV